MAADLTALRTAFDQVVDPILSRPIGELGLLLDVAEKDERLHVKVRLLAPADKARIQLEHALIAAAKPLTSLPLAIEFDLAIPTRSVTSDDPIPGIRNVYLVMSGKGGVGKSTTAVNIALALARLGTRVGLLDADMYGPSIPTMLGINGHPASEDGVKIDPLERFGLKLMSIGFLVEDAKNAIVWRGPMLHSALKQFLNDVRWGELDYLIIDTPPGTGDVALTLSQQLRATGVVMVTTPQEVALADVYKAVSMCRKLNLPILGVVENMSYFMDAGGVKHELFGAGGGQKIAEFANAPLLGQVPIETAVREWGDKGTPIVQAMPSSAAALEYKRIAEELAQLTAIEHWKRTGSARAPEANAPRRLKIVR